MSAQKRPLSPHLSIHPQRMTGGMSILHRITGVILAIGSLGLLWVLISAGMGEQARFVPQCTLAISQAVTTINSDTTP